jgi:hypothetical protein
VVRSAKREIISRSYNLLLHAVLSARFADAQCGFKAGRAEVIKSLLPDVKDDAWFFDTELLILAQRRGLRIYQVPVRPALRRRRRVSAARPARAPVRGGRGGRPDRGARGTRRLRGDTAVEDDRGQ